jgi:hypothetical protein
VVVVIPTRSAGAPSSWVEVEGSTHAEAVALSSCYRVRGPWRVEFADVDEVVAGGVSTRCLQHDLTTISLVWLAAAAVCALMGAGGLREASRRHPTHSKREERVEKEKGRHLYMDEELPVRRSHRARSTA